MIIMKNNQDASENQKKRILLKLSGEALAGSNQLGINNQLGLDKDTVLGVAKQVKELSDKGNQIAIVIGGGNFWRGRNTGNRDDLDRVKSDQIGMLATVMNCIYAATIFQNKAELNTRIMSPFVCGSMTELFNRDVALKALKNKEVVFFAGGIGHPYFSTDMSAVLMAIEISADIILSAKAIDGVYDSDPKTNSNAKKYDIMQMQEIVDNKLRVIDLAAAALALDNHMPMMLFKLNEENSIVKAVEGNSSGTYIAVPSTEGGAKNVETV